jgi:hypothetical protein
LAAAALRRAEASSSARCEDVRLRRFPARGMLQESSRRPLDVIPRGGKKKVRIHAAAPAGRGGDR